MANEVKNALDETIEAKRPDVVDFAKEGIAFADGIIFAYTPEGVLRADLIWDDAVKEPMPAIVWVHNGGLTEVNATRKTRPESAFLHLAKNGYLIMSIDYRISQVHPFPSQIEDSKCAVRFLRANAAKFNIDPERIGVWGASCGGQIAGLMAVQGGVPDFEDQGGYAGISSDVQAAVSWYGGLSLKTFIEARKDTCDEQSRGYSSFRERYKVMYGGTIEETTELIDKADPMSYVDTHQFCPILAMCSDVDPRIGEDVSKVFCDRSRAHGNDVTYVTATGQGHGFFKGEEFYEQVYKFFDRCLKK